MHTGKFIFSQVMDVVSQYEFNKIVKRYKGNFHVRELDCWNQFVQLLFGQLASLPSLRSISTCLQAHEHQLYHLGIKKQVDSSVLSRANERRNWMIFADFGNYLIKLVRTLYADCPIQNLDIDNEIFALDSTTISVSINLFTWAEGKYSRGTVKIHTLIDLRGSIPEFIFITDGKYHDSNALDVIDFYAKAIYLMDRAYVDFEALYRINNAGAFFVTRAKDNMRYRVIEENFNIDQSVGLRSDKIIELTFARSKKLYPEKLRVVEFYDQRNDEVLTFLTNNLDVSALEVAYLYKNRWQIEVFFKWIKQNLTVKKLWGQSENAVKIHLWVAICSHLIVAYVKHLTKSPLSIYEVMQVLNTSLFDKTPLIKLLNVNEKIQIVENQEVKELLLF